MKIVEIQSEQQQLKINQSVGAFAYSWKYQGEELLFAPAPELQANYGKLFGIPLMYPFANRLQPDKLSSKSQAFKPILSGDNKWLTDANGILMHGLTWQQDIWEYNASKSSKAIACFKLQWNKSLDIFQYLPIKHEIEIQYQLLSDGLRVITTIHNHDQAELPLSYGYHPYFIIARDLDNQCEIKIPASGFLETNDSLLPTGRVSPVTDWFSPQQFNVVEEMDLDTCFTDFSQNEDSTFSIALNKKSQQIEVKMDSHFSKAIVYLPKDKNKPYICIEPMIASTNAWHLQFDQLPKVKPQQTHQTIFDILIKERI